MKLLLLCVKKQQLAQYFHLATKRYSFPRISRCTQSHDKHLCHGLYVTLYARILIELIIRLSTIDPEIVYLRASRREGKLKIFKYAWHD